MDHTVIKNCSSNMDASFQMTEDCQNENHRNAVGHLHRNSEHVVIYTNGNEKTKFNR